MADALIGRTIGEDLRRTVARQPEHEALVDMPAGRRWTYRQLDEAVDRVATALLVLGIAKGDRVGIWSPNRAEWVVTEKIHGANFAMVSDGVAIRAAKRKAFLSPGEDFFDHEAVLARLSPAVLRLVALESRRLRKRR